MVNEKAISKLITKNADVKGNKVEQDGAVVLTIVIGGVFIVKVTDKHIDVISKLIKTGKMGADYQFKEEIEPEKIAELFKRLEVSTDILKTKMLLENELDGVLVNLLYSATTKEIIPVKSQYVDCFTNVHYKGEGTTTGAIYPTNAINNEAEGVLLPYKLADIEKDLIPFKVG